MSKHSHQAPRHNGHTQGNGQAQGSEQAQSNNAQGSAEERTAQPDERSSAQRERAQPEQDQGGSDGRPGDARSAQPGRAWEAGRRSWRRAPQSAADVMTRAPRTVRPTDSIQQAAKLMVDEDAGIIPVVDGAKLVGVVTDRDIVCRAVAEGSDTKSAKVSDVMTDDVECVTEDDSLDEVLGLMGERQIRRVPVVGPDDRLVGIISMADLAREADVDERLQETFAEISATRSFWASPR